MKVVLVHDYLREYGGAERVVEALHDIFPEAPVYVASYYPKGLGIHAERIKKWDIRTSWFDKLYLPNKLISPFRIFAPLMFENFDLSDYDVVISSSAIYFAKAVITKPETIHLAYIHTPPRYLYGYATSYNYKKNPITRIFGELANHFLRIWDFETSQRPDILIANSKNVAKRIKKFYRRDAVIIYPPVEVNRGLTPKGVKPLKKDYFLSVSRLTKGKGLDLIIEACNKGEFPLKVVGSGPELDHLKKIASKNIEFLEDVTDEQLTGLYNGAKATIVASIDEDFGIVPVESQAAGTPVIAVEAGGFLETVIDGKTGLFFKPTVDNLFNILEHFDENKFKAEDCYKQANKFSKDRFKQEILDLVKRNLPT